MTEYKTLEDKIFEGYVSTFTYFKKDGAIETLYTQKYVDEIESENRNFKKTINKAKKYLEELLSDTKGILKDYSYNKEDNNLLVELLKEDEKIYIKLLKILGGKNE